MAGIMETITFMLSTAGYRTGEVCPGKIMPEIEEPVIAVNLEQLDTQQCIATVRATVVSPLALGVEVCEREALNVCKILQRAGAQCHIKPYQLDTKTELFMFPVTASFQGNILKDGWTASNSCRVRFGSMNLSSVVSFTGWRETSDLGPALQGMAWNFRVEERMNGIRSETLIPEPFTMTVSFEGGSEVFSECTLLMQKRIVKDGCLHQIWEGVAMGRTVNAGS